LGDSELSFGGSELRCSGGLCSIALVASSLEGSLGSDERGASSDERWGERGVHRGRLLDLCNLRLPLQAGEP
jgi:hypothetical protein